MPYFGIRYPECPYTAFDSASAKYPGLNQLTDNQIAYLELASSVEGDGPATAKSVLPNGKELYPRFCDSSRPNDDLPFEDYARGLEEVPYVKEVDFIRAVQVISGAPEELEQLAHTKPCNVESQEYSSLLGAMVTDSKWLNIEGWIDCAEEARQSPIS
ncbi:hypothetical protein DICA3_E09780 [Diutina catenulata]